MTTSPTATTPTMVVANVSNATMVMSNVTNDGGFSLGSVSAPAR
jgi:hypothetical protein